MNIIKKRISQVIFEQLLQNVNFQEGNGITNFGFEAKFVDYEINFFICDSDKVEISNFGYHNDVKKWIECEPTNLQIRIMQSIIDNKIENFPNNEEYFDDWCYAEDQGYNDYNNSYGI